MRQPLLKLEPLDQLLERARRRKRWLRRVLRRLPRRANVHRYPVLRHFSAVARRRPYLWSYRARPVTLALYAGSVISFLPLVGITILLSLAAAILLRANLTVTVALQFVTNPLTSGPLFAGTYLLGDWIMRLIGLTIVDPVQAIPTALTIGGVLGGALFGLALDFGLRVLRRRAQSDRRLLAHHRQLSHLRACADPKSSLET